jgi:hypothetical protein
MAICKAHLSRFGAHFSSCGKGSVQRAKGGPRFINVLRTTCSLWLHKLHRLFILAFRFVCLRFLYARYVPKQLLFTAKSLSRPVKITINPQNFTCAHRRHSLFDAMCAAHFTPIAAVQKCNGDICFWADCPVVLFSLALLGGNEWNQCRLSVQTLAVQYIKYVLFIILFSNS